MGYTVRIFAVGANFIHPKNAKYTHNIMYNICLELITLEVDGGLLLRVDVVDGPEGDRVVVGLGPGPAPRNGVVIVPLVAHVLKVT